MTHDVKVWEKLFMARTIDKDSILRVFWLTETARFIYQKTKKKEIINSRLFTLDFGWVLR